MTLSSEIFDYLDTLSPAALALDWDNSGLQVGSRNAPVRKILVALDPFEDVCREAAAMGAELVITHHPLFFNSIKSLTDESAVGRAAAILIQNGIGLFSCHTNLDIAPGGVNDCLARALGLENPTVFGSEQLLRKGQIPEQALPQDCRRRRCLRRLSCRSRCRRLRHLCDLGCQVQRLLGRPGPGAESD